MAAYDRNTNRAASEAPSRVGYAGPGAVAERRELLLGTRVSTILEAHEDALQTMIDGGFTLLSQAPLRWAMAHTVTLQQAFRLRGLDDDEQEELLARLLELGVAERIGADDPRGG